jgi:YHS domain-containing protein
MAAVFVMTILFAAPQAFGQPLKYRYNIDDTHIALQGYSPVSYIDLGLAQRGSKEYTATYDGVRYFFTNAEQVQKFQEHPERYVPQYGGYCAMGVAMGKKLRIDPNKFVVRDGKLYLFLNNVEVDALQKWNEGNPEKLISNADSNWESLKSKP